MRTLFHKIKTRYLSLHLQSKLMLTYAIIISIPMVLLALFFYGKVYNMIVSDTIRQEQEESSKTSPFIEQALDEILQDTAAIKKLPFYEQLFDKKNTATLTTLLNSPDAQDFSASTQDILKESLIQDVRIYVDLPKSKVKMLQDTAGDIFESMRVANTTYWNGIFAGSGVTSLHCPSFYLSNYEIENFGNLAYITEGSIFLKGKAYRCYTAVYYSSDILLQVLNNNLPSEGSVAYIINDRDSIIASTNLALSSTYYLNYATIQDSFMSSNNFLLKNVLEEDIYAGMYNIKQPQWYMVVVIPSRPLIEKSNLMMLQYLILFLCCIIVAFIIAISLSRSITKRISIVTTQMGKVRTGPPIPLKEPDVHDEIGDLIDTYNYMSTEMNQLLTERAKAAEELRIAEFNSLQAQINPHFLYNTMDMINWMAAQGRTDEIADAVQNLSRFYKLTLSKKETLSTLGQEIEHVTIYIHLQNMRYHDSIDFVVDIPDELLEYQIPKLTLQPVIENAILHGIMEKEDKKGCIVLTGWVDHDYIELLISDDGIGMPEEKLSKILTGEGLSKTGSNIAIYNTHHRLQILYGPECGLSYESTPGRGTDVSIHLPAKKQNENLHQNTIIKISKQEKPSSSDVSVVEPQALLGCNTKLTNDTYVLQNIHEISEKLPAKEPLYILTHHVTDDFPPHTHRYFEMSYACQGRIINCIDGQELIQNTGDLFFLNLNATQEVKRTDSDALLINLAFWPELFESSLVDFFYASNPVAAFLRGASKGNTNYMYFPAGDSLKIQNILSSIIEEYEAANFHYNEKLDHLLIQLFEYLGASKEYSYYGPNKQTLEILQYVEANCIHKSIEDIASDLYETPQSLSAYLKKHTGRKLKSIINDQKMNLALKLLEQPNVNIYDIAKACGYDDPEELFQVFHKKFHISPEEYRNQFL